MEQIKGETIIGTLPQPPQIQEIRNKSKMALFSLTLLFVGLYMCFSTLSSPYWIVLDDNRYAAVGLIQICTILHLDVDCLPKALNTCNYTYVNGQYESPFEDILDGDYNATNDTDSYLPTDERRRVSETPRDTIFNDYQCEQWKNLAVTIEFQAAVVVMAAVIMYEHVLAKRLRGVSLPNWTPPAHKLHPPPTWLFRVMSVLVVFFVAIWNMIHSEYDLQEYNHIRAINLTKAASTLCVVVWLFALLRRYNSVIDHFGNAWPRIDAFVCVLLATTVCIMAFVRNDMRWAKLEVGGQPTTDSAAEIIGRIYQEIDTIKPQAFMCMDDHVNDMLRLANTSVLNTHVLSDLGIFTPSLWNGIHRPANASRMSYKNRALVLGLETVGYCKNLAHFAPGFGGSTFVAFRVFVFFIVALQLCFVFVVPCAPRMYIRYAQLFTIMHAMLMATLFIIASLFLTENTHVLFGESYYTFWSGMTIVIFCMCMCNYAMSGAKDDNVPILTPFLTRIRVCLFSSCKKKLPSDEETEMRLLPTESINDTTSDD